MPEDDQKQPPRLKPWVLPVILTSILVIVLGLIGAYVDLRLGAVLALAGLIGFGVASWGAANP